MQSRIKGELAKRYERGFEVKLAVAVALLMVLGSLAFVGHERLERVLASDNMCLIP